MGGGSGEGRTPGKSGRKEMRDDSVGGEPSGCHGVQGKGGALISCLWVQGARGSKCAKPLVRSLACVRAISTD